MPMITLPMITHTASELAALCGATLHGDGSRPLVGPASLTDAGPDEVSFLANARYRAQLATTRAGAVIVPRGLEPSGNGSTLLVCENPNRAFTRVIEAFRPAVREEVAGVHPTAFVAEDAVLGAGVVVGPQCSVGSAARVGEGTILAPGVVLGPGAVVGPGSHLHAHVVLYPGVQVGARCVLHAGCVLGSDGFGFEPGPAGWEKVPQCGTVVIGDDCEIGANSALDRGRFGPTRIGNGVKIDNLVHIAHNVVIEDGALLIAQVGVSGSARIERGSILAGQTGVAGHVTVGAGARIAGRAGVTKNLAGGQDYYGYPARPRAEGLRREASLSRVPGLIDKVRALEARLAALEGKNP